MSGCFGKKRKKRNDEEDQEQRARQELEVEKQRSATFRQELEQERKQSAAIEANLEEERERATTLSARVKKLEIQLVSERQNLSARVKKLEIQLVSERQKMNSLLNAQLTRDPNFSNLNDQWRLEKVVHAFEMLKNREYFDALDELDTGPSDNCKKHQRTLCQILKDCFEEAQNHIRCCFDDLQVKINKIFELQKPPSLSKPLRSDISLLARGDVDSIDRHGRIIADRILTARQLSVSSAMKQYIERTSIIAWILQLQSRKMQLKYGKSGEPPEKKFYDIYPECTSTECIEFCVWPALLADGQVQLRGSVYTVSNSMNSQNYTSAPSCSLQEPHKPFVVGRLNNGPHSEQSLYDSGQSESPASGSNFRNRQKHEPLQAAKGAHGGIETHV